MSEENAVEITGATVEEAIQTGLAQLGAAASDVFVDVIDEGSPGVFGLAGRPATVRLERIRRAPMPPPTTSSTIISSPFAESTPIVIPSAYTSESYTDTSQSQEQSPAEERRERPPRREGERSGGQGGDRPRSNRGPRRDRGESQRGGYEPRFQETRPARDDDDENYPSYMEFDVEEGEDASLPFLDVVDEVPEEDLDDEASIGKVVLNELLERMSIRARIIVRRAQAGDQADSTPWILDVQGGNLSRLIGRRGETLAALQYVTRLITSRELQRRAEVIVDVTGYKSRRAQSLNSLATRMADQAVQSGSIVSLEPMPPHERRIIHVALRERPDVTTRSVGEGPSRKVTIIPSQSLS